MSEPVVVVRTGNANIASVQAGLRRAGADSVVTEDPERVRSADRVVLPGVGALGPTRRRMDALGLSEAVRTRFLEDRPLFAVCLGLQLLLEGSDESPDERGLGLVPGWAQRFPDTVRVPQMGWNRVEAPAGARLLSSGAYYFANTYRLVTRPPDAQAATGDHGGPFVAAFERGSVLACQFHPELSGALGTQLVRRWLEESGR